MEDDAIFLEQTYTTFHLPLSFFVYLLLKMKTEKKNSMKANKQSYYWTKS